MTVIVILLEGREQGESQVGMTSVIIIHYNGGGKTINWYSKTIFMYLFSIHFLIRANGKSHQPLKKSVD